MKLLESLWLSIVELAHGNPSAWAGALLVAYFVVSALLNDKFKQ